MMNEPTPKEIKETRLYAEWGLTDEEYHQIETILQREPNYRNWLILRDVE